MTENNALHSHLPGLAGAEVSVSASRRCAEKRKYDIRPGWGKEGGGEVRIE